MFHKTRPLELISLVLASRSIPESRLTATAIKLLRLQSSKLQTPVLSIHRVFLRDHSGGVKQPGRNEKD